MAGRGVLGGRSAAILMGVAAGDILGGGAAGRMGAALTAGAILGLGEGAGVVCGCLASGRS